jgi:hypothetical protein
MAIFSEEAFLEMQKLAVGASDAGECYLCYFHLQSLL